MTSGWAYFTHFVKDGDKYHAVIIIIIIIIIIITNNNILMLVTAYGRLGVNTFWRCKHS